MKKTSKSLKFINKTVNFFWWSYVVLTIAFIPLLYFMPLPQDINFSLKKHGKIYNADGKAYDFDMFIANGVIDFPNEDYPTPPVEYVYFIIIIGITLFIFYQFKKITNNIIDKVAFNESNFLRLRRMGLALLSLTVVELLYFFLVQNRYAELIEHSAFLIKTRFNLYRHFDWYAFFCGLGLLVLAEVFKEGFSLKQETELTI